MEKVGVYQREVHRCLEADVQRLFIDFPSPVFFAGAASRSSDSGQKSGYLCQESGYRLGLQYPNQFALQEDGLNSFSINRTYGYRVVRDHRGNVVTGSMMTTAATLRPQQMSDSNDPADDLRLSINAGLVPNANG